MKSKNKTFAAWLAFIGGPLGLHRFYLHGLRDWLGWLLPVPTLLGVYGLDRMQHYGVDDKWSWVLIPLLGFVIAGCSLMAIIYGLATREKWNGWFNPGAEPEAPSGATSWWTIAAMVLALMIGTIALVSGITMSFQQYFDYQVEEGRKISE